MGVFGTGLYSGDFAMDLCAAIRAVSRLPFDGEHLVDILRETEPAAAENPEDEDHATFWLVVADQFAKRGIECSQARNKAIEIIDRGTDLAMLEELGMTQTDLRRRKKVLDELRVRLHAPATGTLRPTLKKPQPFLMDIGDILIYPTCSGDSINPYLASRHLGEKRASDHYLDSWRQDGWGAVVIIDRGRAFDFLAWYRPVTMVSAMTERPTSKSLRGEILWRLEGPGTCSAVHFK